jgi:hypothetical protein
VLVRYFNGRRFHQDAYTTTHDLDSWTAKSADMTTDDDGTTLSLSSHHISPCLHLPFHQARAATVRVSKSRIGQSDKKEKPTMLHTMDDETEPENSIKLLL